MRVREQKRLNRREALGVFSAALATASCSGGTPTSPIAPTSTATSATTTTTTPSTGANTCSVTPNETEGPYPSKVLPTRADVREDRQGLAMTLAITVVNTNDS